MASANVVQVTESTFQKVIQNSTGPVLLDFWAEWCGPCKMLGPTIDEIANEFVGKAVVGKVDLDTEQSLAAQFSISSIPTLLIFKQGQVVKQLVGVRPKKEIVEELKKLI
jgi:thioredoxin 1